MKDMGKANRYTRVNWARIIDAVTSSLGLFALIVLVIGYIFYLLPNSKLPPEATAFLLKAAMGVLALIVFVLAVMTWFKPANLIFDKDAMLMSQSNLAIQDELKASTAADAAASGKILQKFWRPDGKTKKQNETRLIEWMKANGLANISITAFIRAEYFAKLRRKAIRELGIASGEDHEKD
jgi:hypothetical protein